MTKEILPYLVILLIKWRIILKLNISICAYYYVYIYIYLIACGIYI